MRLLAFSALLAMGCRPQGLPEEPAGRDAADPEGPAPAAAQRKAVDASAFDGVSLPKAGHHGHSMKHGGAR